MTTNDNNKVAIIISTFNRPDFLIRQLHYMAKLNSPHPIYIGDASEKKRADKARGAVKKLGDKIPIYYEGQPYMKLSESVFKLLNKVKEKYVTFNSDDDYHIPGALTACAEFLENNSDYATATSYTVNFKLKESGAYGELAGLKDYPRPENHKETASERIVHHFNNYMVTNISVNRTKNMLRNWSYFLKASDRAFDEELIPASLALIDGKAKTLDRLGIVRQMHDRQYGLAFVYDWLTDDKWLPSYKVFFKIMSERLAEKDNIPIAKAENIIRQAFWLYLNKQLPREYKEAYPPQAQINDPVIDIKKIRRALTKKFPQLKSLYRRIIVPQLTGQKQMHYEVLQPDSKYYKDFKPVMDSFTRT